MKNTKKRGFTIVELVIVIAVIAILASVLIPTFSNVVKKAQESKILQEARNAYTMALAEAFDANGQLITTEFNNTNIAALGSWKVTFTTVGNATVTDGTHTFTVTNGEFSKTPTESNAPAGGGNNQGGGQG